jgi:hypothetical protein
VNTLSCLVEQSTGNDLLRLPAAVGRAHCRSRAAPVGRVAAGSPSRRQRPRLDGPIPLRVLIQAVDPSVDVPGLMKLPWTGGPSPVDLFHRFSIEK